MLKLLSPFPSLLPYAILPPYITKQAAFRKEDRSRQQLAENKTFSRWGGVFLSLRATKVTPIASPTTTMRSRIHPTNFNPLILNTMLSKRRGKVPFRNAKLQNSPHITKSPHPWSMDGVCIMEYGLCIMVHVLWSQSGINIMVPGECIMYYRV